MQGKIVQKPCNKSAIPLKRNCAGAFRNRTEQGRDGDGIKLQKPQKGKQFSQNILNLL